MVLPRREDYTNEASEALERAHAWASDMRNAQLDAEHLALGMLSIKDGMATKIFEFLGVELSEMKKDLEFSLKSLPTLGQRQSSTRMIYIEPRLKKVLDEAQEERQRLNDDFIAIEHLLKGLLSLDDGEIDRLLKLNNISHVNKDTYKLSNLFYSYRLSLHKKEIDYGRNLSIISKN